MDEGVPAPGVEIQEVIRFIPGFAVETDKRQRCGGRTDLRAREEIDQKPPVDSIELGRLEVGTGETARTGASRRSSASRAYP